MRAPGRRIQEVAHQEKPDIIHAYSPVLNAIPALWAGVNLEFLLFMKFVLSGKTLLWIMAHMLKAHGNIT